MALASRLPLYPPWSSAVPESVLLTSRGQVSGLTLCQDLVTDSPELALEVAEEIVYRFRERGRGVIGGGFVVHLLCLEIGLGRLRWLCLRSEGVGSLEECSVRHG
jgi:hypothetical protein